MIADRIKNLREDCKLTQSELAKKTKYYQKQCKCLGNGSLSVPSTTYLIELAQLFHVSTDYLLGLPENNSIDISFLSEDEWLNFYSF